MFKRQSAFHLLLVASEAPRLQCSTDFLISMLAYPLNALKVTGLMLLNFSFLILSLFNKDQSMICVAGKYWDPLKCCDVQAADPDQEAWRENYK